MSHLRPSASLACLVCLALIALEAAGFAQTAPAQSCEGREIVRLDLDAPPGADTARVRDAIRFREGDLYHEEAARAAVAAIYALGDFTNVSVEPQFVAGGVRVVFHLKARPRIHAVLFEGDLADAQKALTDILLARAGAAASPYSLKADLEAVRNHYIDQGYLFADVRQQTTDVEGGMDILYRIEAGPKLTVESIRFEGNTGVPDEEILPVMMGVKSGGIFDRGKYDPALLRSDLLAVRELFRRKGYLDATVGHEVLFDESKERAFLVVQILEGPLYRIERMTIEGAHVRKTDEVLAVMKSREGDAYSQEQLDKDIAAIQSLYGRIGYIKADVRIARTFSEKEPKVTLTLTVTEGEKYYVNKVIIRGNLITQDHVVRRSVTILPGDVANADQLAESKRRLLNTGYFSIRGGGPADEGEAVHVRFVDSNQPGKTDVLVEVVEGSMGDFSIGAGYSSSLGLVGNIRLTHRNFDALRVPTSWAQIMRGEAFSGDGQELTISASPGTIYNDYRLAWTNPSVWDSPYSVGFDLYLHDYAWSDFYTEQHVGGSVTVGRRFFDDLTVSLTPRWEWITIRDLDDTAPEDAVKEDGRHERRSLALGVTYDRRNNLLLTSSGYRLSASVEMAGTVLGGGVDTVRETLEARRWWTLFESRGWGEYFLRGKHILNVGGTAGAIESTGTASVPIFERFFIGGLGSMRGFEARRVGPVDDVFHKQVGGQYMLLANAEYEIPVVGDYFRLVLFVDSGSLGFTGGELGEFRIGTGGGIRLRLPIPGFQRIPISIYIASPVVSRTYDKSEIFSFQMGTGFAF